jgi:hypothetical protein
LNEFVSDLLGRAVGFILSHFLESRYEAVDPELGVRILDSSFGLEVLHGFDNTRTRKFDLFFELANDVFFCSRSTGLIMMLKSDIHASTDEIQTSKSA